MEGLDYIILRTEDGGAGAGSFGPGFERIERHWLDGSRDVPSTSVEVLRDLDSGDLSSLQSDPNVLVAPDFPVRLHEPVPTAETGTSSDQGVRGRTWGLERVGITDTTPWKGEGTTVAILDTGIDVEHEAFAHLSDRIVYKNFTDESDDDDVGHGTHCAGTIFGGEVDGLQIGVAPGIKKAVVAKVLGQRGGSMADLIAAMQWARQEGAQVVSMSLGFDYTRFVTSIAARLGDSPDDEAALRSRTSMALEAYLAAVRVFETFTASIDAQDRAAAPLFVAATGNDSRRDMTVPAVVGAAPPAAADNIIAVGALQSVGDERTRVANFSNAGADLVAPGVGVLSAAVGGGVTALQGTSMATPHVAGLAALWLERQAQDGEDLSVKDLMLDLTGSASKSGIAEQHRTDVGRGLPMTPPAP